MIWPCWKSSRRRRLGDEDQADAGGQAFPERRFDALAQDALEPLAVLVERIGREAREDRGRQRDREDAERELVEELRQVEPARRAQLHRDSGRCGRTQ